jgi:ABC-type transport system involved in multi-copper enzyme maturation permease subunit
MGMGSVYVAVALGYCSDNQLVTLTRRELSAYFYSPIGFLVLGGMALAEWLSYVHFVGQITGAGNVPEPIVQFYFTEILILFLYVVQIPILTMRLLAEEKQTGSLEVLLTSPVNESTIVVGKFLATLIFYLVCWVPSGLFLIALREIGDQPFDYRPLLGFYIGLAAQGAMFISMGLFFSSITRNQVVAAVLTFDVLLGLLFVTLWRFNPAIAKLPDVFLSSFGRLSFYHMWLESLGGQLPIRDVLLALSLAVFGLFLTVKVLEIRKWS